MSPKPKLMINIHRWVKHFENNGRNRREPDWNAPLGIQGKALQKLRKSIQQFQLGDGGGPCYLIARDRENYLSDPDVRTLVDLWFNEEREHSRLLGALLKRLGGEEITSHWSFGLFCGLRKWLGVRFELHALLGTEIVSHVYYKMLLRHGRDPALRDMCRLIIRDESGHIAFHRERLADEGLDVASSYGNAWAILFHLRTLAAGTVLWVNHRSALRALGASDAEFYRRINRDTRVFIKGLRKDKSRLESAARRGCRATWTVGAHR